MTGSAVGGRDPRRLTLRVRDVDLETAGIAQLRVDVLRDHDRRVERRLLEALDVSGLQQGDDAEAARSPHASGGPASARPAGRCGMWISPGSTSTSPGSV